MKVQRILWLIVLLLLSGSVYAQESSGLREPTTAEYIQAASDILTRATDPDMGDLQSVIEAELMLHHPDLDRQSFEAVERLYGLLPWRDETYWLATRVVSWVNTRQYNLAHVARFPFDSAQVTVTDLDVNADGQNEWLLNVPHRDIQGFLAVRQTPEGAYAVIPAAIPAELTVYYASASWERDILTSYDMLHLGDLTADGTPEIVVLRYHRNANATGGEGQHHILSWRDYSLQDLGGKALSFRLSTYAIPPLDIVNLDDDPALELRQTREITDNWGCTWHEIITFDWDGQQYVEFARQQDFPDTVGCHMRLAEQAAGDKDYSRAVEEYQRVLAAAGDPWDMRVQDYARLRLGMVYVLRGQLKHGVALISSAEQFPELRDAILRAYYEAPTPLSVCLSAYDFVMFNPYYFWNTRSLDVGRIEDNIFYASQGMYIPPPAYPTRSICDAKTWVAQSLADQIPITHSPVKWLTSRGFNPGSVYRADLNGDGVQDWMVWPSTVDIAPVLFVSEGDRYAIGRGVGYAPNPNNRFFTVQLPDHAGTALLNIDYSKHYDHGGYGQGRGPDDHCTGRLYVGRLENRAFSTAADLLLCEVLEPEALVDDLKTVSAITGWTWSEQAGHSVQAVHYWNSESATFELLPEVQAALNSRRPEAPAYVRKSGTNLLRSNDWSAIIELRTEALAYEDSAAPKVLYWRYLAAQAYEALGQPGDALNEYRAITQDAPESGWGILAALHVGGPSN